MGQPQQPELRRSGRSNTSQEDKHAKQTARGVPKEKGKREKNPRRRGY